MDWPYLLTPYILPLLATVAFLGALAFYGWRHRTVPGALPFVFMALFAAAWALFEVPELVTTDLATRYFWLQLQGSVQLPILTAMLCFALGYAGLGKWLTRRKTILLVLPPLIVALLAFTNDAHHLMWTGVISGARLVPVRGPANFAGLAYACTIVLVSLAILIRLFIRSPLHRWPVALIVAASAATMTTYLLNIGKEDPMMPFDPTILATNLSTVAWAVALFGFRIFDVMPLARDLVIERTADGIVVIDAWQRIVDLNPAAEQILGTPRAKVVGRDVALLWPMLGGLSVPSHNSATTQAEVAVEMAGRALRYEVRRSALLHPRGLRLGELIVFHDVTESRRAQEQFIEQQRALATLAERERVARELHDGLAQVLGYAKVQAQAARELLERDPRRAQDLLSQLVAVAHDAQNDVREYILGAGTKATASGLPGALESYLRRFSQQHGIATELIVPPGQADVPLEPAVLVQVLRIVQEALANAMKHARASRVQVRLSAVDAAARIVVEDDGVGFDPAQVATGDGWHFGLRFMRERAEAVGGSLVIRSALGQPTQVIVQVPARGA